MAWNRYGWRPYVPVAKRRAQAQKQMSSLRKKGLDIQPVKIEGRKIATTFWGAAWCSHLESFSDYENRLPRGRTYVRNGSVCHLEILEGEVRAKVAGSEIYNLHIRIKTLPTKKWADIKRRCVGRVGSLLELLQGKLSNHVMEVVTDRKQGLFPLSSEISLDCDCPDWAVMCKHVAAALYGVGARLDQQPELLFTLRGVDHEELIDADAESAVSAATSRGKSKRLSNGDLADVFGIDLDTSNEAGAANTPRKKKAKTATTGARNKKVTKKPRGAKKTAAKRKQQATAKKTVKKKSSSSSSSKKKTAAKKTVTKKSRKKSAAKKKKGTRQSTPRKTAAKAAKKRPRKKATHKK